MICQLFLKTCCILFAHCRLPSSDEVVGFEFPAYSTRKSTIGFGYRKALASLLFSSSVGGRWIGLKRDFSIGVVRVEMQSCWLSTEIELKNVLYLPERNFSLLIIIPLMSTKPSLLVDPKKAQHEGGGMVHDPASWLAGPVSVTPSAHSSVLPAARLFNNVPH
ncbi:hypothetical protein NPIL_472291 [Nephila pilipes]|uniref:Uncharacterized protein n=1 Tax=Nephila pilipes TaxID=299642 RepID=A0A8X6MT00_NEPPI|nr:hypothetical protein NPIL_472291 [Nephila pilipes]